MPDASSAVQEMRRVTRPGGTVTAAVWDYADGMAMLPTFWDAALELDPAAEARDEKGMPCCREGELARLFGDAGLTQVEAQALTVEQGFASFEDYWSPFLLGTGPAGAYVASLTQARRTALSDRLRRQLAPDARPLTLVSRAWAARGRVGR